MACSARAAPDALFEGFCQVGPQGRESWRQAAQGASCQGNEEGERRDGCIDGDRIYARQGIRQQVQSGSDRNCGKRQAQQPTGKAEQKAFKDRFADDDAGTRAQSQSNRVLATPADGPDQQQTGNIDASNQQHDGDGEEQSAQQRSRLCDVVLEQWRDITLDGDRRLGDGKIAHNLLGNAVGILCSLREGDVVLETGDHLVSPKPCVLVGKFVRCQAHGYPELRLVEAPVLQRKLKTARHHADNRIDLAIKSDGSSEDVRIALVTVQPQCVADDRERLMGVLFLLRKDAAKNGTDTQSWKDARGKASSINLLRNCTARNLIVGSDVAAKRGKGAGCIRVCADLAGRDGSTRTATQVIS